MAYTKQIVRCSYAGVIPECFIVTVIIYFHLYALMYSRPAVCCLLCR